MNASRASIAHPMLAMAVLAAALGSCSHATRVDDSAASFAAASNNALEMDLQTHHPLIVDAPQKLLRPAAGRRIQEALNAAGYPVASTNEQLGPRTMAAIALYQADLELASTGYPDGETLARLGLSPEEIYKRPIEPAEADENDAGPASRTE